VKHTSLQRAATPVVEVIDDQTAAVLRAMGPLRRLAMIDVLYEDGRAFVERCIRVDHPDWPDDRVLAELNRRAGYGAD